MKSFPKISIVTPNFNGGRYLEKTILSIISQNYPNLEYIIIDGGSTDNSVEIIKKYKAQLKYWVSEPDNGMYEAIQKGFDKSTGEIMAWLNSDDLYHANSLYTVAEIFENEKIKWIMGYPTNFDDWGRASLSTRAPRSWYSLRYYFGDVGTIQQESVFWHRSLWEESGSCFNQKYKYAADLELWSRFFKYEKLYLTYGILGGFRRTISNTQLSIQFLSKYREETKDIVANHFINKKERRFLLVKRSINFILRGLHKLNILNIPYFERLIFKKIFNIPELIIFDEKTGKFIL